MIVTATATVVIVTAVIAASESDSDDFESDEETLCEECVDCGALMGGRLFTEEEEEEFDEHPDRDRGYDEDGHWHCVKCGTGSCAQRRADLS